MTTAAQGRAGCTTGAPSASVSLKVLPSKPEPIRKSKTAPWRAAVLIGVNVLMAAHIIQWAYNGAKPTIAPVEPSETMYTLELGLINPGFIFFSLALLSTFIFGRF